MPLSLLFVCLVGSAVFAQESGNAEKGKETVEELDKLDKGSSLERRQYRNLTESYKDRVSHGIKLLTIVTANFGDEIPEAKQTLEKVKKEYQASLRYYYRRAFIASGKTMAGVDKELNTVLEKFAKNYDAKLQLILSESADLITNAEQNQLVESTQEGKSSGSFREISEATQKLRIAYSQLGLATDMVQANRFYDAIVHYRIAKDYGIRILIDFKDSEADKKAVSDKYAKDLSDNRNQILEGKEAQGK
ncbi:MAG: hypothetical protein O9301_02310 [Leptospira sp.]|nr:hypothetical protein [Leptospira sp.]